MSRPPADGVASTAAPTAVPLSAAPVASLPEAPSLSAAPDDGAPAQEPSAEDYVRAVQAEPRDESWAKTTMIELEEDLRKKGERLSFRVRTVDCRRTSCFAELAFHSLRAAQEGFKAALGSPNQSGCPLRLLFPTDGDKEAPVMGILIVDCHERRSLEQSPAAPATAK